MKYLLWGFFRYFGIDVRPARSARDITDFIKDRKIDLVLDVGANIGQFGTSLRSKGYQGKLVSFEPVKSAYISLQAKAKADGNWEANNFALGASAGEATINVSESSVFSSILAQNNNATEFDGSAAVTYTETIKVRTLDEVTPDTKRNILLKIDTQGYERKVLEGGMHTLSCVKGVLMEIPIIHLYEGTWQLHEALAFMASLGFATAQIHPVNYDSKDQVSLVEIDFLFRPTN